MGIVKEEWSPSSSGLAMAGSKEPLFSCLQSALRERGREREREKGEREERKESSYL